MTTANPTLNVPTSKKILFSHRGLNRQAPENTIPAFQLAKDAGVQWIETDVDILGDGTAVVLHDSTLDRTTNRSGSIYDLTAQDLPSIDAGAKFEGDYANTPLPTLDDLIDFLNENKMNANIEIKAHEGGAHGTNVLVGRVVDALKRLDPEREVIISSFSELALDRFHQQAPEYAIGLLFDRHTVRENWLSTAELVGASYIHLEDGNPLDEGGLARDQVRTFVDAGYPVNVWTVNDPKRAAELTDWGVTGVFTDVADEFREMYED